VSDSPYDALIIGGGPAGSVSAMLLVKAGLRVCLLEKARHPRFHLGESILPRNLPLIQELGLERALRALPHVAKYGAEFGFGNNFDTMKFGFQDGLLPGSPTFNIERAPFDKMLFDAARDGGAEVFEDTSVREILKLEEGAVEILTHDDRTLRGRVLLDCSGQSTVVGRHLGIRRGFATDPHMQKVAYFQHFENVERLEGEATGHPSILMASEGWFWIIGLSETKTSIGFVTRPSFTRELGVPADRLLQWAIARCPVVRHRMLNAIGPATNEVAADFSYKCRPVAGPGYFLIGDAASFLDPIFSAGVTLAMMGAQEAARHVIDILCHGKRSSALRRQYSRFVEDTGSPFWKLNRDYYRHSFRELFMNGVGPLQVHGAVISILAGQVFPRPVWALRWRLWFYQLCVRVQPWIKLVPRRPEFSLMTEAPVPVPLATAESVERAPQHIEAAA
jgi:flavin-dependent dehydrogenase